MHASVQAAFHTFSAGFEGDLDFMYLDIDGKVTIGIGNLIDPMPSDLGTYAFHPKGDPAKLSSPKDIEDDWHRVKGRQDMRAGGGGKYADVAQLRLDPAALGKLFVDTQNHFESELRNTSEFADLDNWAADAQLGLMSMAWAMGPGFGTNGRFPGFRAACNEQNWDSAASECHMIDSANPGLRPRNAANRQLFENAAETTLRGSAIEDLHYPAALRVDLRQVFGQQLALRNIGYDPGPIDGSLGTRTRAAIHRFQEELSLVASGEMDAATVEALSAAQVQKGVHIIS